MAHPEATAPVTAQVIAFAPAAERRRERELADRLKGVPLYRLGNGTKGHAIRWKYPVLDGQQSIIFRCGAHLLIDSPGFMLRAGTDRPVCTRCAVARDYDL